MRTENDNQALLELMANYEAWRNGNVPAPTGTDRDGFELVREIQDGTDPAHLEKTMKALADHLGRWFWRDDQPRLQALAAAAWSHIVGAFDCQRDAEVPLLTRLWESVGCALDGSSDYSDIALDPMLLHCGPLLDRNGWRGMIMTSFIRDFACEVILVEAARIEQDSEHARDGKAVELLVEFIRQKIAPAIRRSGGSEDLMADIVNGLLGCSTEGSLWGRRASVWKFNRARASLGGFAYMSALHVIRDNWRRQKRRDETVFIDFFSLAATGEMGCGDELAATGEMGCGDELAATGEMGCGDELAPLELSTIFMREPFAKWLEWCRGDDPLARRRLILFKALLLSCLIDEENGAHTADELTWQAKFVCCQGATNVVLGRAGGTILHPRFDSGSDDSRTNAPLLAAGFAQDSVHAWIGANTGNGQGDTGDSWLKWSALYSLAFLTALTRSGYLNYPSGSPKHPVSPNGHVRLPVRKVCDLALRKSRDDSRPPAESILAALKDYRDWIHSLKNEVDAYDDGGGSRLAIDFPEHDWVEARFAYPGLFLATYAQNAFCALFLNFHLPAEEVSVDVVRSKISDLRKWLKTKGGRP